MNAPSISEQQSASGKYERCAEIGCGGVGACTLVSGASGARRHQTEAARVFGVSLRAANKWVALDKGDALRALKLKRRGRRSGEGRLNPARAERIRQMLITGCLTTVGRYLKSWGMTPQKPCAARTSATPRRLHAGCGMIPGHCAPGEAGKAAIYWGNKMGPLSYHVTGTSYSLLGQRLIRMPGYCPEPNSDGLLNQDVKTNALEKNRPTNRAEMMTGVRSYLYRRRQRQPQIIRNHFQEQHIRYAA